MKPVVVVVGLFAMLAIHVTAGFDVSSLINKVMKCKNKTGISDATIKSMKGQNVLLTHEEQCYSACLNHGMGIVYPNNTINVEGIKLSYTDKKKTNPDFYEKSMKLAEICASKITASSDDCAAIVEIKQCFVEEGAKIGVHSPCY